MATQMRKWQGRDVNHAMDSCLSMAQGQAPLGGLVLHLGTVKDESSRSPRGQARGQEGLAGVGGSQD